jgi:pimeloyl-ACP methyl ester carboxylesterase
MPTLSLDDTELYYEAHGQGRPFLFNAATATWGEVWKFYQVDDFSRDHRVIIFDQRGTGRSTTRSKDFSTPRLAADAAALLRHLDARDAIVLGHSNGGRVSQALALGYPELVGRLILASSGAAQSDGPKGIPIALCMQLVEKGYERFIRDSGLSTGFTASYRESHAADVERFLQVRAKGMPKLEIYLGHVVGRQNYDPGDSLATLKMPALVMVGDDEDHGAQVGLTHLASARQLAEQIPGAKLAVLKDQGHYYYFSAPEETSRVIRDFLRS